MSDWLVWQLADSAFPTGGFAHSGGLEAAWQHGEIRGRADLHQFVVASLSQLGHALLPLVAAAHCEPQRLPELDRLCDTLTSNHVANRASRLQGQALLASAERIFALPELRRLREPGQQPPCGHFAPVFGMVMGVLGLDQQATARLLFFQHLRGLVAGAVRLGIIGPMEGQALQHRLGPQAQAMLERCEPLSVEDIAQTAPLLDVWQGTQDRLYSRLFQS
ncbi:MAG TPA: urease accessory UreF family protein [Candidatus Limnocylindria bacterium]|nr:urease accessory UreF family protein [Candidatus Limnocylindria bacterium]